MFLLIFRFVGETAWNYREVDEIYEEQQLLIHYSRKAGKVIEESQLLGGNVEICDFLGIDVESTEIKHEKVVWS